MRRELLAHAGVPRFRDLVLTTAALLDVAGAERTDRECCGSEADGTGDDQAAAPDGCGIAREGVEERVHRWIAVLCFARGSATDDVVEPARDVCVLAVGVARDEGFAEGDAERVLVDGRSERF